MNDSLGCLLNLHILLVRENAHAHMIQVVNSLEIIRAHACAYMKLSAGIHSSFVCLFFFFLFISFEASLKTKQNKIKTVQNKMGSNSLDFSICVIFFCFHCTFAPTKELLIHRTTCICCCCCGCSKRCMIKKQHQLCNC